MAFWCQTDLARRGIPAERSRPEDRAAFSYVAGAMLDVHGADTVTAPLI